MKVCSKCGTQLEDDLGRCPRCGSPVAPGASSTGTGSGISHSNFFSERELDPLTRKKRLRAFVIELISDGYLGIWCLILMISGGGVLFELFDIKYTGIPDDVFREAVRHGMGNPIVIILLTAIMILLILPDIFPILTYRSKWLYFEDAKNSKMSYYSGIFDTVVWTLLYFIGPSLVYILSSRSYNYVTGEWNVTEVKASLLFFVFTIIGVLLAVLKTVFSKSVSEK